MAKTLRNPKSGAVVTVNDAEAEKLSALGWVYTSKYEVKRQAALARARQQKTEAA